MNLFIDTNVFLTFYHLTSDDLEELKKLVVLIRKKKIQLYLPEQVSTEFHRNRANKIADALKRLREQKFNLQFPQLSKDYAEYDKLRKALKKYEKLHEQLLKTIEQDVLNYGLKADSIIEELFKVAKTKSTSEAILKRARARVDIGNPPGKKGSYGDAIIWESLLSKVPEGRDLCFITDDTDYYSPLDDKVLDPFLVQEWADAKRSKLISYRRLSEFFRDKYPNIELATELEKDLLIQELAASPTYAKTHQIIAGLSKYTDFTTAQLNEMVDAAVSNSQVHWIINDPDVREFYNRIIKGRRRQIDWDNLERLNRYLRDEDAD